MTDDMNYGSQMPALGAGETILWRGKPQKKGFIATRCLSMMPIAVIWLLIDMQFIGAAFSGGGQLFMIPFFALHLMPVWIWLGSAVTAGRRWKNTMYYATNRRIIIQGGFLAVEETSVYYKDIRNVHIRVGFLDKIFGTGDIIFDDGCYYHNRRSRNVPMHMIEDLEDARQVYSRIQKIVLDMQTDMEFPNAYRPEQNPGYNTDYRF